MLKIRDRRKNFAAAMWIMLTAFAAPSFGEVTSSDQTLAEENLRDYVSETTGDPLEGFDFKADERMRRVVKVLRTTDKSQVNQYVPVAFELKHVNPFAVIRFIRRVIEVEEGNWWTFVSPEGNSGRLLINVPVWQVQPMKDLVAIIDREGLTSSAGDVRGYHHLKHRDPADPGLLAAAAASMTGGSVLVPDRPTGALYIEDAPSGFKNVSDYLENHLDVPTPQVLVRAKIYEVDLTNDGTIGLDFHAWKNGPGRNLFAFGAYSEYFNQSRVGPGGDTVFSGGVDAHGLPGHRHSGGGYNSAYFYDVPSAYFDYLTVKGRARVLTSANTTVLHGSTAAFGTGEEILYYLVQEGSSDLAGARPPGAALDPYGDEPDYPDNRTVTGSLTPRARSADFGLRLEVTPVIADASITLDIEIDIVSQLGFDGRGVPTLSERNLDTSIRTIPGREYIIGGLTRSRSVQTTRKVPVLGSIPGIGWLFGGEITTTKRTLLATVVQTERVADFSGLGESETQLIADVLAEGMGHIDLPETPWGFDGLGW